MTIELMKLPYAQDALEPVLSKETISYHYGKHHRGYVDNLNKLIKDTSYEDMTVEEIVWDSDGPVFNNAAQIYNHNMYWNSLRPEGDPVGSGMTEATEAKITKFYGSLDNLKTTIKDSATKHFGSGWVWICEHEDESLFVQSTSDAGTPLVDPLVTPLLVIDVWEHAYYLQYKNDRAEYIEQLWTLINWDKLGELRIPV